jgi:hypothetical protein
MKLTKEQLQRNKDLYNQVEVLKFDQQLQIDKDCGRAYMKGYKPPEESENVKRARQGIADAVKRHKEKEAQRSKDNPIKSAKGEIRPRGMNRLCKIYCPHCGGYERLSTFGELPDELCCKCGGWMDFDEWEDEN